MSTGNIKVGETGRTFRVNAEFDMSSYTELTIVFTKPDGTTVTKTTADGVALGASQVTDDDLGLLTANKYITYDNEDIFDTEGTWKLYGKYTNTAESPDDVFIGDTVEFQVDQPGRIY